MATSLRQPIGCFFRRKLPGIYAAIAVDDEGNGPNWTGIRLDCNPSRHVVGRFNAHLAPDKLAQVLDSVGLRNPVQDASALTASVEHHHQAGLFLSSTPAGDFETKRAMPTPRCSDVLLDVINLGLPDERAVSKEPKVIT